MLLEAQVLVRTGHAQVDVHRRSGYLAGLQPVEKVTRHLAWADQVPAGGDRIGVGDDPVGLQLIALLCDHAGDPPVLSRDLLDAAVHAFRAAQVLEPGEKGAGQGRDLLLGKAAPRRT